MDNGGVLQKAALHLVADILLNGLHPLGVGQVALGQHDDAVFHVQQGENVQVLPGLGHKALIRGDDQQHHVDAGGAHEHVVDQPLVSGHVHNAGPLAVGQRQLGKADLNRDAALLLFLQPVRVHAGQGLGQAGLAVIHMAGGSDDNVFHILQAFAS